MFRFLSPLILSLQTGGHGFGANPMKGSAESAGWIDRFIAWFQALSK